MTLLNLPPERIQKLIESYEKQIKEIKKNAITMAWYMRGGMTYEDILNMSNDERQQINELIDSNLETTKKTQMPFFQPQLFIYPNSGNILITLLELSFG